MCPDISLSRRPKNLPSSSSLSTNLFLTTKTTSTKKRLSSKTTTKTMTKSVVLLAPAASSASGTPERNGKTPAATTDNARKNLHNPATTTDSTTSMKAEIDAAVSFLTYLLVKAQFSMESAELFRKALTELLRLHYKGHWYPQEPLKGSGYRCLRVNGVTHPLLAKAADLCKLPLQQVRRAFPAELTVWVDPGDVSVRFGEEGSIGVFYAKQEEQTSNTNQNGVLTKNSAKNRLNFSAEDIDKAIVDGNFTLINTPPKRDYYSSPSNNSNRSSPDSLSSRQTTPSKSYHHGGYHHNYHHQQARFHNNGFWNQQAHHDRGTPPQQQQQQQQQHGGGGGMRYLENRSPQHHQHQNMVFRRFAPASETCNMEYQLYGNVHMSSMMASETGGSNVASGNLITAPRHMEPVSAV